MSEDFVTKLQLQLRDAAEREARRGPTRRLARTAGAQQVWRPALALAAIALVLFGLISAARSLHHRHTTPAGPGPHVVLRAPLVSQGGGLWTGFGSAWATDPASGQILRLDPRTRAVRARIPVSSDAGFDVGAGAVWVLERSYHSVLVRIDAATNRIAARIPLPFRGGGVIVGRGVVWTGDGLTLVRINPATNRIDRTIGFSRGGYQANGVATDGRRLYLSRADGTLLVFDARTGARLPTPGVEVDGFAAAAARGVVFLATRQRFAALDVRTARTLWSQDLDAQTFNNAVLDGRTLWVEGVARAGGRDRLWRLDAATGRITGTLDLPDFGAPGMAPVAGRLWVVSTSGSLQIIE
jgi:PQQ-like domain